MTHRNAIRVLKRGHLSPTIQAAAEVQVIAKGDLTPSEAMVMAKGIRSALNSAAEDLSRADRDLMEFKDRKGWKAMGYKSWVACVAAEFEVSLRQVNHRIAGARIRLALEDQTTQIDEETGTRVPVSDPLPEKALRPLAGLPPEDVRSIYAEARAAVPDGKVTAKVIKAAADRRRPGKVTVTAPPQVSLPAPVIDGDWRERARAAVDRGDGVTLTHSEAADMVRLLPTA